jgi:hypothetical protein
MRLALYAALAALSGCVVYQTPPPAPLPPAEPPPQAEAPPPDDAEQAPVVSVNVEPPMVEPAPIAVGWAPPPMLVEVPPPMPFASAVWVGGYWVWQGNWVWAHGHWMGAPRPDYVWVHPYYEHRGETVIFVDGHWGPRGVVFMPPPPSVRLVVETPAPGVIPGPRPIGPDGCFVPAPPGSRRGIIIPAPVGTAPAVVTSAPAVVATGMRITNNVTTVNNVHNNVTNVTNVTKVTNVTNVTIVAPPGAVANGHAFNTSVPAAPHLAAGRPALVQARAPEPVNTRPLPVYTPGSHPPALPHPQPVSAGMADRPGHAFGHEPDSMHGAPGTAAPPAGRPPTPPTAYAHDPQPAHAPPYGEPNGHRPQPQDDHKMPPGQAAKMPPGQAANPAQPQHNDYRPPQQAQNTRPQAPPPQADRHNAAPPQAGNAAPPQAGNAAPPQAGHQGAPAHAASDNHSKKPEGQSDHDGKHERQSNER